MHKNNLIVFVFLIFNLLSVHLFAQTPATPAPPTEPKEKMVFEEVEEGGGTSIKLLQGEVNKKRIRRHLNLISSIKHDEEISIPEIPLTYKGSVDLVDIQRIKGTDTFRILPLKGPFANGIITIHNKKTGQILVELRIDIRDQTLEKTLREVQALLMDIEGIEYKIVNNKILLDGFVLLPKDLRRIGNIVTQFQDTVTSLVSLSPMARKKIVEYIARDVNNPEVSITSVGDFIKLEGFVNSAQEKQRVQDIVTMYMPDIVTDKGEETLKNLSIAARKPSQNVSDYVLNYIQIRSGDEKVEPPPKMIQFVIHVVEYSERYLKSFDFKFSPSLTTLDSSQQQNRAPSTINDMASLVNNLLPKLNWARNHGFIRLLDTASILVQDKAKSANITRSINISNGSTSNAGSAPGATPGGAAQQSGLTYTLNMTVTNPTIKSERSGLVQMDLNVNTTNGGQSQNPNTTVATTVSVRDRQSAALAGIITKKSENQFGGPTGAGAIVTLNHGKGFTKSTSNYVLFVTPIIKSSASAGVEQVKKKFRMKE